ncbi:MAG TPA: ubiquitin-like small modifier protein 1 [Symbiobacteriaceae bacterium]|nr:ubiquitin-like small modifier protein 1 [Symbiobacteriaceae bacterium]
MKIKLFANLRAHAKDGLVHLTLPSGAAVSDALAHLFDRIPALAEHVVDPGTGELLPYVNIMLRGRLIRDLEGLQTKVDDSDELAIFPPIAGG